MKKLNKKSLSIITFLVMSFVFMFAAFAGLSISVDKAFATGDLMPLNVKFISSHDALFEDSDVYTEEIYFDTENEKLVDEAGEDLTGLLQVKTDLNLAFYRWSIYNYADKEFDILPSAIPAEFGLDNLVAFFITLSDEEQEAYYQNNSIVLHALATSASTTTLVFDDQATTNARVFVGGVDIGSQITLNQATTYSIQAVADDFYHLNSVHLSTPTQYASDEYDEEPVNQAFDYTFTSGISDNYYIAVSAELTAFEVIFETVDENLDVQDTLIASEYIDVLNTSVKLDEELADKPVIINTDSKEWIFVEYKIENQTTGDFDNFDIDSTFTTEFLNNYISDGIVKIYAIFTKLYKVEISTNDFGSFIVEILDGTYQNITNDNLTDDIFTYYVVSSDTLKITAMPNPGCKFVKFDGVNEENVTNNICILSDFDADYTIAIEFMAHAYKIEVAAVDSLNTTYSNDGEIIEGFEDFISIYVNNVLAESVVIGDRITMISTNLDETSKSHRFIKYQIYSFINGWEELVVLKDAGKDITENFINSYVNQDQTIYIRACFVKTYKVTIDVETACAGRGYFNIKFYDKNTEQYIYNAIRLTKFSDYVDVNTRVSVEAKPYSGYKFTQYTIPNAGTATKNIITKDVMFENLSFGIVFDKIEVELKINTSSNDAAIGAVSSDKVQVGEKITFTYELNVGRKVKNVTINNVNVNKMKNVTVTDTAVIVDVTSEFLDSLGNAKTVNLSLETGMDGEFISMAIIIPIALVGMLAGAICALCMYLNARKKLKEVERRDI